MTRNGVKVCEMCGQPLPEAKGKGRPRNYCSDDCRKLIHMVGWLEDLTQKANFTSERATILRRQLWQIGNSVKARGQNGA